MRQGIIFSATAILLLASLLISSAVIYQRVNFEKLMTDSEVPARVDRTTYDTISMEVARIMKTSINNTGNVTINEQMPFDVNSRLSDYENFLDNVYPSASNIDLTTSNSLYISNHTTISYGSNKEWFNLTSNEDINYYIIMINASSQFSSVQSDWAWTSEGAYVELMINDSVGGAIIVNSSIIGHVNPALDNSFSVNFIDGSKLMVNLSDRLLVNTTGSINSSTTIGVQGIAYSGSEVSVENNILELSRYYRTIVK